MDINIRRLRHSACQIVQKEIEMKRIYYILAFLIFNLIQVSEGQEVQISAGFDTSAIFIGDQIKYTVTINKPLDYLLTIPVFKDTLVKNIEILKGPVIDSTSVDNRFVRIRHEYLVTSFDSGFYQVPPVYAEMRTESGIKRYYSDYSWLKVMRVNITPPDTASAIFDIVDPGKVPLTAGEIIPWIVAILAAGALIWLLLYLWKRLKKPETTIVDNKPKEPAHVIAFRELEKLKEEKLWQKGEIKLYYSRLTEIIRQYLLNRFTIPALEMTTVETLDALRNKGIEEDETFRKLRTILTGGDLVKFARYQPEPTENELHFDYAWDFVKSTMIVSPPPEEEVKAENVKEGI